MSAARRSARISAAALVCVMGAPAAPALAIDPPDIGAIRSVTPADPTPKPVTPMRQSTACATSAVLRDSNFDKPAPANVAFDVQRLHDFATGEGVSVAVIDSGVQPNRRLPALRGGGDYIGDKNGLEDCDHHGTLVAGIIAAQPSTNDGFIGVAPDAELISIRQTSSAFEPENRGRQGQAAGSSTLSTLAQAVVRAANMGADVINLSVTACFPAQRVVDTSDLAQALKYAVQTKDAVIVTSAGNTNDESCKANPGYDPANATDPGNWEGTQTVSMPSFYSPLVISVGGSDLNGQPYAGTMPGPWVDVAAPAVDIVSLDPSTRAGSLTNGWVSDDGVQTIAGTSFASAYVAGLAALIRQRYPDLDAAGVRARIIDTAQTPADTAVAAMGAGLIDPVAALTASTTTERTDGVRSRPAPAVVAEPDWSWVSAAVAWSLLGLAALVAMVIVAAHRLRAAAAAPSPHSGADSGDRTYRSAAEAATHVDRPAASTMRSDRR